MEVSVCGSLRNFIGQDGSRFNTNGSDFWPYGAKQNKNQFRDQDGIKGIYYYSEGVEKSDPAWGTMAYSLRRFCSADHIERFSTS